MPSIETRDLFIGKNKLVLASGYQDIRSRLVDPDHYRGPSTFQAVVQFGQTFVELGMRDELVPDSEQWNSQNLPPEGIKILAHDPDNFYMRQCIEEISTIASSGLYSSSEVSDTYYRLTRYVLSEAAEVAEVDPDNSRFFGLVRAGAVAGEMLGIPVDEQFLVQTKRLPVIGELPGDIAIGISYFNPEQISSLNGQDWVIPDPAGATFGSIVANIACLVNQGIRPESVVILNTVASQRGALFALDAIRTMGIERVQIVAGGYSPRMDGSYYLETPQGMPSVGDAGDWLNGRLPPDLQLQLN